jgi:hypothetical protein
VTMTQRMCRENPINDTRALLDELAPSGRKYSIAWMLTEVIKDYFAPDPTGQFPSFPSLSLCCNRRPPWPRWLRAASASCSGTRTALDGAARRPPPSAPARRRGRKHLGRRRRSLRPPHQHTGRTSTPVRKTILTFSILESLVK